MRFIKRRLQHLPTSFYSAPFDYVVGFICILSGFRVVLNTQATPASISVLPQIVIIIYVTMLTFAGVLILWGLFRVGLDNTRQRVGMWLAGTAFMTYGSAAILYGSGPQTTQAILSVLAVGIGCGARALGLAKESQAHLAILREATRQAKTEGEESDE